MSVTMTPDVELIVVNAPRMRRVGATSPDASIGNTSIARALWSATNSSLPCTASWNGADSVVLVAPTIERIGATFPLAFAGNASIRLVEKLLTNSVGIDTWNVSEPSCPSYDAWIIVSPSPTAVTVPSAATVAIESVLLDHDTFGVMSSVLPSENIAVAVNWVVSDQLSFDFPVT
ncbi:MAG: hypothetical protein QM831_19320 [Kofleriaceae bacterium]